MAPGDLNLKKSWFPKLMKNQAKVWEMEQEALQEHKRIHERQLELEKEKQKKELIDLQVRNNPDLKHKLISNRIDWMYDDPTKNREFSLDDNEKDEYLLGKKKIDVSKIPASSTTATSNDRLSNALQLGASNRLPSERDISKKTRDDPMMKIEKEQIRKLQLLRQQEKILKDKQSRESSRVRPDISSSNHRSHRSHHSRDRDRRDRDRRDRDSRDRRDRDRRSQNDDSRHYRSSRDSKNDRYKEYRD